MQDIARSEVTHWRFELLQPYTRKALRRKGIVADAAIASLTDRDLRLLAFLGPQGRADVRRHFPSPESAAAVPSANDGSLTASRD